MCANFSTRFADGVSALKNTCEIYPRVNVVVRRNLSVLCKFVNLADMLDAEDSFAVRHLLTGKKCALIGTNFPRASSVKS